MPSPPPDPRAKSKELLPLQVFERNALLVRMGVDKRPSGRRAQVIAILGTHAVPQTNNDRKSSGNR
jgi:hypothetical protein